MYPGFRVAHWDFKQQFVKSALFCHRCPWQQAKIRKQRAEAPKTENICWNTDDIRYTLFHMETMRGLRSSA